MTVNMVLKIVEDEIMVSLSNLSAAAKAGDEVGRARVEGATAALADVRQRVKLKVAEGPQRQRPDADSVPQLKHAKTNPDRPLVKKL